MKPSYATLREAYPLIYTKGQLGFGIECGIGWCDLINQLSADVQQHIDQTGVPQVVATQVKEKFAGMRFYHMGGDGTNDEMISTACGRSLTICEICGVPGTLHGNSPDSKPTGTDQSPTWDADACYSSISLRQMVSLRPSPVRRPRWTGRRSPWSACRHYCLFQWIRYPANVGSSVLRMTDTLRSSANREACCAVPGDFSSL